MARTIPENLKWPTWEKLLKTEAGHPAAASGGSESTFLAIVV